MLHWSHVNSPPRWQEVNPRTELEARYQSADFSVYFRFLDACRGTEKALGTQEHHICPRKQFPEFIDDAENKIVLRSDDHAHAHKLLGAAVPELSVTAAWLRAGREAARNNGQRSKQGRLGVCGLTLEQRQENGRKGAGPSGTKSRAHKGKKSPHSREQHQLLGRISGPIQGRKNVESGQIAFARHSRWHVKRNVTSVRCSLCQPS